jgi:hypothetical protein
LSEHEEKTENESSFVSVYQSRPSYPNIEHVVAQNTTSYQDHDDARIAEDVENPCVIFLDLETWVIRIHSVMQEVTDKCH